MQNDNNDEGQSDKENKETANVKKSDDVDEIEEDDEVQEKAFEETQDKEEVEVDPTKITFEEVKEKSGWASFNDKTMKSYCNASKFFVEAKGTMPYGKHGEADEALESFFLDQYNSNPRPGNLYRMNQILLMIRILHPKYFFTWLPPI